MPNDFDDLLTTDAEWYRTFSASLNMLADWSSGQLALWPVDDYVGTKSFLPCPRRGLHARVADCWMCWCDVAWGHATASEVLAPGEVGGQA